ncbi:MAG: hypothetical protein VX834_04105 [Myxococcota bacterium]|nr:hypothetical protein [Myxococcota bacterium]
MRLLHLITIVLALTAGLSADAKRLPEPGGEVRVQLFGSDLSLFEQAHVTLPLLERSRLGGLATWRSDVIALELGEDTTSWLVRAKLQRTFVLRSIQQCLGSTSSAWPARVLRAASISAEARLSGDAIALTFSKPVGAAHELLSGCWLQSSFALGGPFKQAGPTLLEANKDAMVPGPLLDRVQMVGDAEQAHIREGRGEAPGDGRVIAAAYPDVLLLVQRGEALKQDVLGVAADAEPGLATFYRQFAAGTLVQVYSGGHGMASRGVLPPGLAEPHPLPRVRAAARVEPLALSAEDRYVRSVPVYVNQNDRVARGFEDRLSLFLGSRSIGVSRVAQEAGARDGLSVVRWRPPSRDPGISMLELMGRFPELRVGDGTLLLKLLSDSRAARLEAALEVERAWIDSRRVIPLATLDVWYEVTSGLEGVSVSDEGVPLLDDAFWGGSP